MVSMGLVPLDPFTKQRLFDPLQMHNTSWKISGIHKQLVKPYEYAANEFRELPPTGYPDWPAGMLRSSPISAACLGNSSGAEVAAHLQTNWESLAPYRSAWISHPQTAQVTFQSIAGFRAYGCRGPQTSGLFLSIRTGVDRCRGDRHSCGTYTSNSSAWYRSATEGAVRRAADSAFP
jgi:CubicO group peptidase (beta-lactamase class C family)